MKKTMHIWINCVAVALLLTGCGCGPKEDPTPIESTPPAATSTPTATVESTPTPTSTPEATPSAEPTVAPSTASSAQASAYDPNHTGLSNKIGSATIKVDGLRIRSGAGTGYAVVDYTKNGGTYPVYRVVSDGIYTWYQIGKDCWIADDGTWLSYVGTGPTAPTKDTVHIEVEAINIRSCPNTGCPIVATARAGENYKVYAVEHGETYDWLKLADDQWLATDKSWTWVKANESSASTSSNGNVVVKVEAINVRSGPGTEYGIVGSVQYNDRVPCLQVIKNEDLDWVKIAEGKWIATDKGWTWIQAE